MKKIALVLCCEKKEQAVVKKGFFAFIMEKVKNFMKSLKKEELFKDAVKNLSFSESVKISLVTLPYTITELAEIGRRRVRQINIFLHQFYVENHLDTLLLPEAISAIHPFDDGIKNPYRGNYLYKCLLVDIIDEIFTKRGIKTWELDITIIQGQDRNELYKAVNLLSPWVRYLTVISAEKELIEQEAGDTFLDSGLAVIITEDYKNSLRNSDLIINFDDAKGIIINGKTKQDAVIINYSAIEPTKVQGGNLLVNGIGIKIPYGISQMLGDNLFNYFSSAEIGELLLVHSLEIQDAVTTNNFPEIEHSKRVSKTFKKEGYRISEFEGRRNLYNVGEFG